MNEKQLFKNALGNLEIVHDTLFKRVDETKVCREILDQYWDSYKGLHDMWVRLYREAESFSDPAQY